MQGREAYDCYGNVRTTDLESLDELVRLAEDAGLREDRKPSEARVTNFVFLPQGVAKDLQDCRRLQFLAKDGRRVDCYFTKCFFGNEDGPLCGISVDAVLYEIRTGEGWGDIRFSKFSTKALKGAFVTACKTGNDNNNSSSSNNNNGNDGDSEDTCSGCKQSLAKSCFSSSQWKKKPRGSRMCTACAAATERGK